MIYICTLTRDGIDANTACDLILLLRTNPTYSFAAVVGSYIQTLREGTASAVLASGATHLGFVDSDMMFPKDAFEILLSHKKDIIAANYVQRVEQEKWTAMIDGISVSSVNAHGLQEVDSIGMGLALISTDVLKKLPKPWFDMPWKDGYYLGEDISFCQLARRHGYKIWIDHDLSQNVRHIGNIFLGADNYRVPEYTVPAIDGFMFPLEMQFLYSRAKEMKSIVELGSWKGRSTHALASGCKGTVWCVDHWQGSPGDLTRGWAQEDDIYATFLENTKQFTNIKPLKMTTLEAAKQFEEDSVDMVFIDAGHSYEDVSADIDAWYPKATKLICGHDYGMDFPGVAKAVNERFGKPDGLVGTIWYKAI